MVEEMNRETTRKMDDALIPVAVKLCPLGRV
jgi:hypothetical protein